jgi:transposase InsO family protein
LKAEWVSHDIRDEVIDFVTDWSDKTEIPKLSFIGWLGISKSKFYEWKKRFGKVNEHNARIPRDHWLEDWEKEAILKYETEHPLEGYRRLTFMMLDEDIVAVSPSTVYRVLKNAGRLGKWNKTPSKKGEGYKQPEQPHQEWHTDISYININNTFYFLISVLDGYSRYIVHWEIRESMKTFDIQIVLQKALEKFPGETPRLITDNGPQFISRDLKQFIRLSGMSHTTTSPYYPQSNGKIERFHQSIKVECIRPQTPLDLEDARRVTGKYIDRYNNSRLHSGIGYVTPKDRLEGNDKQIFEERDRKLADARERRKANREAQHNNQLAAAEDTLALTV